MKVTSPISSPTAIHLAFAAQVIRQPEAIALQHDQTVLTYRQLDDLSTTLAHRLRARGLSPGTLTGIYLSRTPNYLVAILAILKAGGAYVPLDPTYPSHRLQQMLDDAKLSYLVTETRWLPCLADRGEVNFICLDEEDTEAPPESPGIPHPSSPSDLAYVIYTSGSTGRPKAACITHSNVWHYVQGLNQSMEVGPADHYLHTASFSFSSSVRQWALPLLNGARITLATTEQTQSPAQLLEVIKDAGITIWDTLATVWRYANQTLELMADEAAGAELLRSDLRLVTFSGGPLTWESLLPLLSRFPRSPKLLNIWGNTETIGGTVYQVPPVTEEQRGRVPIGRPINGVRIDLRDDRLRPVAPGQSGEICIAGPTVGLGYLAQDALTQTRFLLEDQSQPQGGRYYRTGDLGRWLPSGDLECLGRSDDQVKIRGYRVELGDVETALRRHPSVKECVVLPSTAATGDLQLTGFVVPQGAGPEGVNYREFLLEQLPGYMVPANVKLLDRLPLTPNGKLDRAELSKLTLTANYQPSEAKDETEVRLRKIWEAALRVSPIRVTDNFFELGGHSLLSVSLLARVEKEFQCSLPLTVFLEAPTIRGMAEVLQRADSRPSQSCIVTLQDSGPHPPFFCVHGIGGGVLNYRHIARYLGNEQPFYAIQAPEIGGIRRGFRRIEEIASYYIEQMRDVQASGPYYLGGLSFGGKVAFEMAQQLRAQGEDVAMLALFDTRGPGYPRFHSKLHRGLCHIKTFLSLPKDARRRYVEVRKVAVQHHLRQLTRLKHYRRDVAAAGSLTKVLHDIGLTHAEASDSYSPQPYDQPIIFFRASEQPVGCYYDPLCGWGSIARGGIDVFEVPGGHAEIVEEPHARILAQHLGEALRLAREARGSRSLNG